MDALERLHVELASSVMDCQRYLRFSPPRVVSIVDWIVDQLLEWHQVQACQLRHITFPQR